MLCSQLNLNIPSNLLNSLAQPLAKEGKVMKLVAPLTRQGNTGKFPRHISPTDRYGDWELNIGVTRSITIAPALGKPHRNTFLSVP